MSIKLCQSDYIRGHTKRDDLDTNKKCPYDYQQKDY